MKFKNIEEEAKFYLTHTEYRKYYDNGQLMVHGFKNMDGKNDSETFTYHRNGQLSQRAFFRNGVATGEVKQYYEDGKLKEHTFLVDYPIYKDYSREELKRLYPEGPWFEDEENV